MSTKIKQIITLLFLNCSVYNYYFVTSETTKFTKKVNGFVSGTNRHPSDCRS